jgi:hypothetical protein
MINKAIEDYLLLLYLDFHSHALIVVVPSLLSLAINIATVLLSLSPFMVQPGHFGIDLPM